MIAKVNGRPITMAQLQQPLMEGYGLRVLLNLIQFELAKQGAEESKVTVTADDIAAERERTLDKLFGQADKSQYPALLEQFLDQKPVSRPEFDLFIQTNAYLRKIAEPQIKGKITEQNLRDAFAATYGENVQVEHIQCANLQEINEAKRHLAAGEPFEWVARTLSQNPETSPSGGKLPPFSRSASDVPQEFKDVAFSLKEGEVSDPVQAGGAYHLIKLEQRIAPKAVKFEAVKESVRANLEERVTEAAMKRLRQEIAERMRQTLQIYDPTLKRLYDTRLNQAEQAIEQAQRSEERDRAAVSSKTTTTTTMPAAPTTGPSTQP
jgi:foldase protein PrsA